MPFIVQAFFFFAIYLQVFLIITLFEYHEKKKAALPAIPADPSMYPTVTVIVPCFNEEATVIGTIESLKQLDYPKEKLSIVAVDDGSTDDTWSYLSQYANDPQVSLFRKENGGKHTAVNFGIEHSSSDMVSCLDADSFVHPQALLRMLPYFTDPSVGAVTPAIKVRTPKSILESIQYAEYNVGIFLRKMYSVIDAIHVTPGPFSVFRRSVFAQVGMFRSAYNTEDLEIALRLHSNNIKIENSHTSFVFTTPPSTVRALVKQRVRWTTGFLLNMRDYRRLLFNKKHGHIGTFTLPAGIVSLVGVLFFAGYSVVNAATSISDSIERFRLVGFSWHLPQFHWFFFNTTTSRLLIAIMFCLGLSVVFLGKRLGTGSWKLSKDIVYYTLFYGFLAPVWIAISGVKAITRKTPSWR